MTVARNSLCVDYLVLQSEAAAVRRELAALVDELSRQAAVQRRNDATAAEARKAADAQVGPNYSSGFAASGPCESVWQQAIMQRHGEAGLAACAGRKAADSRVDLGGVWAVHPGAYGRAHGQVQKAASISSVRMACRVCRWRKYGARPTRRCGRHAPSWMPPSAGLARRSSRRAPQPLPQTLIDVGDAWAELDAGGGCLLPYGLGTVRFLLKALRALNGTQQGVTESHTCHEVLQGSADRLHTRSPLTISSQQVDAMLVLESCPVPSCC